MIFPKCIKKGDIIGVTAPSDGNTEELDYIRLKRAKDALEQYGYRVIETPDVRTGVDGRSAAGEVRAKEFLELWNNPAVNAIISAKGGDYLMEILPHIDYSKLYAAPKWFQGFSDNTGLTFTITTICDIAAVYCNNFNDFAMKEWHESLKNNIEVLSGRLLEQTSFDMYQDGFVTRIDGTECYDVTQPVRWVIASGESSVNIKGRLIGGCLDVLLNIVGTRYDYVKEFVKKYKEDGIVWYIESFSLDGESIERGLWQLNQAGWFENASGFIFGRPAFYSSGYGNEYDAAVMSQLKELNLPVIVNADIGHKPPQLTLVNGAVCNVKCSDGCGSITMKFIE